MPKVGTLRPEVVPALSHKNLELYQGNCETVISDHGFFYKYCGEVDLVLTDPPFNVGYGYDVHDDNMAVTDYFQFLVKVFIHCTYLLKENGSIYVCSGLKHQALVFNALERAGFKWRNTLCWHYTFGPSQKSNWTPSWVAIHYAVLDTKDFYWDPPKVPSARQMKYNDRRAKAGGKTPNNVWILDPAAAPDEFFRGDSNTVLESRVCGTFKERTPHPCQMPEAVTSRIVQASCPVGGLVFDPFLGSGTTLASALKLGSRGLGIELSESYLMDICVPRLKPLLG